MQQLFKNLSIKRKLTLLAMTASGIALLTACVMFLAYDIVLFRQEMVRSMQTHAAIVGSNSTAALTFNDGGDARNTLLLLRNNPHIVNACIYDADGRVFATYVREGVNADSITIPTRLQQEAHRFISQHLELFHPVVLDGKAIGTVYIRSDLRALQDRIVRYLL